MTRRPLSQRNDESFDALHEGVPPWLTSTLQEFVTETTTYLSPNGVTLPNRGVLQKLERELHAPLDWRSGANSAMHSLFERITVNPVFMLDVVDWCLGILAHGQEHIAAELSVQLREGGSAWTVAPVSKDLGLVRRVDDTVSGAAIEVISSGGRASQHLKNAWAAAYGLHPDPSSAYRESVRAVEAIGASIIIPNDKVATLGRMISAIGDAPSKWEMVLQPAGGDAVLMVRETMQLLWTSQLDRHGTADETVPLHVSLEEAQAAVHLATTLVHWFQAGAIRAKS